MTLGASKFGRISRLCSTGRHRASFPPGASSTSSPAALAASSEQRGALLTRQLRIRLLDPVPDLSRAILERLSTEPPPPLLIRAGRRRAIGAPRRLTRWAVAVVPLGLAFSGFASSAFANPRVVPTHPVTSCTAALARR